MKVKLSFFMLVFFTFGLLTYAQEKFVLRISQLMTPEEENRTGVAKLTKSEREALEVWLTDFTVNLLYAFIANKEPIPELNLPNLGQSQIYLGLGSDHWVSKKIDGGKIIKLEDGSLWEINPIYSINTVLWLVIDKITVVKSDNLFYPYKLINHNDNNAAEAKLISK